MQKEYAQGKLTIDPASEDIHSFIESELTKRLGDIGKKVHTGRSRNDQVATAMKIYARTAADELLDQLDQVVEAF
ncbi:lyase family protein, partial [Streptococcus anginosus]